MLITHCRPKILFDLYIMFSLIYDFSDNTNYLSKIKTSKELFMILKVMNSKVVCIFVTNI